MFEFPWVKARKRREAEKVEAERIAKDKREEKEKRAAQILANQLAISRAQRATVTPIKASGYGLTAQRAVQEDQRQRGEADRKPGLRSTVDDETLAHYQTQTLLNSLSSGSSDSSHSCSGGDSGGSDSGGGCGGGD